jgi:hypothetical protein
MSAARRRTERKNYNRYNLNKIIGDAKEKYIKRHPNFSKNFKETLSNTLKQLKTNYKFTNDLKDEEALLNKLEKNYNYQNIRTLSFNYRNQLPALIRQQKNIISTRKSATPSTATPASNRNKKLANLAKKYQTLASNIRGIKTGGSLRKKNRTYRK